MTNRIREEAVQLLLSPIVALRDLKAFITGEAGESDLSERNEKVRIIIDKDGNATLNLNNAEVQQEMRAHINDLAAIKVSKPKGEFRKRYRVRD